MESMLNTRTTAAVEIYHADDKYYFVTTIGDRNEFVDTTARRYHAYRHRTMIKVPDTAEGRCNPPIPDPDYYYFPQSRSVVGRTLWCERRVSHCDFFHEWMETIDGTMEYIRLSPNSRHKESSSPAFQLRKLMMNTE